MLKVKSFKSVFKDDSSLLFAAGMFEKTNIENQTDDLRPVCAKSAVFLILSSRKKLQEKATLPLLQGQK